MAFARVQNDIKTYLKNKEEMRKEAVEMARANNELLECPICCEDELVELDLIECPMGHTVCRNCARRYIKEIRLGFFFTFKNNCLLKLFFVGNAKR